MAIIPTVAWFSREDWPEVLELTEGLQPEYDDWLTASEKGVADAEIQLGAPVRKVWVGVDQLRKSHLALGRKLDAKERMVLAISLAGTDAEGSA